MITLDYYDDNTVRDNAVFFTQKRIFAIVIASERKKVLEEHKYNYSIFTNFLNTIDKEILCDSFSVDNNGHVYIMNSDFDTVLDESEDNIKKYHHIVDNRDGHTLTVKELKEKYLSENINGKSPENNKSESKSHSNDSRNDRSN